jgi:hypothetical protein
MSNFGSPPAQPGVYPGLIKMFTTMADGNNNAMSTLDSVAVLDSGTLNGSYNMLHAGAAENGETLIRFSKGTMASIPCE